MPIDNTPHNQNITHSNKYNSQVPNCGLGNIKTNIFLKKFILHSFMGISVESTFCILNLKYILAPFPQYLDLSPNLRGIEKLSPCFIFSGTVILVGYSHTGSVGYLVVRLPSL